jgi:hypothetical protein
MIGELLRAYPVNPITWAIQIPSKAPAMLSKMLTRASYSLLVREALSRGIVTRPTIKPKPIIRRMAE